MTSELFKEEVDRLDSGLSDHPDTSAYKREGRAVRRRRRGFVVLGAGALVAAAVVPAVLWGGSTPTTGPTGDVAADPSVATSDPAPAVPVDASFGAKMRAAVERALPEARFVDEFYADHYEGTPQERFGAVETPPNWSNVFMWAQHFEVGGLQSLDVSAEWRSGAAAVMLCDAGRFAVEKSCDTRDMGGGYVTVLHDGIRLKGEAGGDWKKMVEFVSPPSPSGAVHVTQVLARVQAVTWEEADLALPPIGQLGHIAALEELRLPEPAQIP